MVGVQNRETKAPFEFRLTSTKSGLSNSKASTSQFLHIHGPPICNNVLNEGSEPNDIPLPPPPSFFQKKKSLFFLLFLYGLCPTKG